MGDSRAILSAESGNKIFRLSRDHKPNDEYEKKRIIEKGGKLYQSKCQSKIPLINDGAILNFNNK